MPAVGIRCQTHIQLELLKWCSSTLVSNKQKQQTNKRWSQQHSKNIKRPNRPALGKQKPDSEEKLAYQTLQQHKSSDSYVVATENAGDKISHGSNPTWNGWFKFNTMTSDATSWNTAGMLGSLADDYRTLLGESQEIPRMCHTSVQPQKIKPINMIFKHLPQ